MTVIDLFSKFAWAFPLKTKESNLVVKHLDSLFKTFMLIPETLHSDNGGEFTSKEMKSFLEKLGINFVHGQSYKPQTQGCIERFNRTIKELLSKAMDRDRTKEYISNGSW